MYGRADLANSSYLVGHVKTSMTSENGHTSRLRGYVLSNDMENGKLLCESCVMMA